MNTAPAPPHRIRFGAFEVDLKAGEVRTDGVTIRLQEKPFQILRLLLEHPGEVMARQEIQRRLWSEDTFVDFEHSINTAVMRLREALGDSADHPQFIETVGRRGYRFIAPVDGEEHGGVPPVAPLSSPKVSPAGTSPREVGAVRPAAQSLRATGREPPVRSGWLMPSLAAAVVLACTILAAYWITRPLTPPRITRIVQLTNNGRGKGGRLLTDGPRLYFWEDLGGRTTLVQASIAGGETVPIPASLRGQPVVPLDVSPDMAELLVGSSQAASGMEVPLWTLPVLTGSPRRLGDVVANAGQNADWSPDIRKVVYTRGKDLWVANSDGSNSRKILTASGWPRVPRWSPDGKRLRFTLETPHGEGEAIWEVDHDGNNLHQLLPDWGNPFSECCGVWTADGKYFIFQATRDNEDGLWAVREETGFFHKISYRPVRLTSGPVRFESIAPSRDGKKLFALGIHARIELMRYDARSRQFAPYLGGISASEVDFRKDREWACYSAYPEATLWKSKLDGSQRLQLTFPPMTILMPRWSPDGGRIAFMGQMPGKPWKNYIISADGGTPQQLIQDERSEADPQWSLDGNKILFGRFGVTSAPEPEQTKALHVLDLASRQVTKLPNSEGVYSPRWSPDGRYVVALDLEMRKLILFDLTPGQRVELAAFKGGLGFPNWSRDGASVLVWGRLNGDDDGIYQVRLSDHRVYRVVSVEELAGSLGRVRSWGFGLTPDDSILITRDHTMTEVYALDWEAP